MKNTILQFAVAQVTLEAEHVDQFFIFNIFWLIDENQSSFCFQGSHKVKGVRFPCNIFLTKFIDDPVLVMI